jgi:hypothetical protein
MKAVPHPEVGSMWTGSNAHAVFKVLLVANAHTSLRHYPTTVVFMGHGGKVWSLPISKWCKLVRSGAFVSDPTACLIEGEDSAFPG